LELAWCPLKLRFCLVCRETAHVPAQLRNGFQVYEYAVIHPLAECRYLPLENHDKENVS